MASFFCERTAEYLLAARINKILRPHFRNSIPIYFWKTREGNTTSASIHKASNLRILAMYARRPKKTSDHDVIQGKINQELFEYAAKSYPAGVPAIAGFPVVRSIWELTNDVPILWMSLKNGQLESDHEFSVDLSDHRIKPVGKENVPIDILTKDEIVDLVLSEAKVFAWEEAMHIIAELRHGQYRENPNRFMNFFGIGGYRPLIS